MCLLASSCKPSGSQSGFLINTLDRLIDPFTNQTIFGDTPHGNAYVSGSYSGGIQQQYAHATDNAGEYVATVNGSYLWTHQVTWTGDCPNNPSTQTVSNYTTAPGGSISWRCEQEPQNIFIASPATIYQQQLPTSVQVDVGTSDGQVNIIDAAGAIRYTAPVASGNVTFAFPAKDASSNPFSAGEYVITVDDDVHSGAVQVAYAPITIASESSSYPSPFGVAPMTSSWAEHIGTYDFGRCIYSNSSGTNAWPVVTSFGNGTVYGDASAIAVGPNPNAVATYGSITTTKTWGRCNSTETTTQTGYAIVTNSGSDTVSIVNLATNANLGNVTVGHAPVAVAVDANGANAYVANYDDGTVSVVSLGSQTQAAVIAVGAYPAAVTMDPGGSSFWVGGEGYIEQFSTSNHNLLADDPVSGFVTSLAVSQGQGEIFYTSADTSGNVTTLEENIGSRQQAGSYAMGREATSGCWGCGGPNDPPLQANSTLISNILDNGLAVGATPTGFALISLMSHQVVYSGTTPNPVRGIAVLPDQSLGWVTVPDSNLVLTIPISSNQ